MKASEASGLVTSSTSGTRVVFDRLGSRKRRLKRSVQWAARCHTTLPVERLRAFMVTLTYAQLDEWAPLHISSMLKLMRQYYQRLGVRRFRYVWVGELQQRGAVHYHVLVWLPVRFSMVKPDNRGWWPHGMTRVDRLVKNAVGYVTKYVQKFDSVGRFPRGIRLHGAGGFEDDGKRIRRWWGLPGWCRNLCGVASRVVRAKGGGMVDEATGLLLSSPWWMSTCERGVAVIRSTFEYVGGIAHVSGPFSTLTGSSLFADARPVAI